MRPPFPILYEDNHLLAVVKPVGLATMGAAKHAPSLLAMARQYIRRRYHKPSGVYLGVVSRLDAPVSGVVVLARTSKAAARLTELFETRQVEKTYWAIVEGQIEPAEGKLSDWVRKDDRRQRMQIARRGAPDAKLARMTYWRLELLAKPGAAKSAGDPLSLVEIRLETGRKHQIRLQLADLGHPILGDEKYGSQKRFPAGIALHARRLAFTHPVRHTPLELVAPVPPAWRKYGVAQ